MGLLPDIDPEGNIIGAEKREGLERYTPPRKVPYNNFEEEKRMRDLNNLGFDEVSEGFTDSKALDY